MRKTSFVLKTLKIMGLQEILKLSEVLHLKQVPLKKAAGEELVSWYGAEVASHDHPSIQEGKVLPFHPKKSLSHTEKVTDEESGSIEEASPLLHSDLLLWQREISRQTNETVHKKDVVKGYKRSNEMFIVKESSKDGKDKFRIASIKGVLVDKKSG